MRIRFLAMFIAVSAMAAPVVADAQWQNVLRDALRRSQQQRPGGQPVRPRPTRERYGQPQAQGGRYETDYAVVTQRGCDLIEVRFKDAVRRTLVGKDYADPFAYLAAVSTALPKRFGSIADPCPSVAVTVYAPDGRMVVQDRLLGDGYSYRSANEREEQMTLAVADLPADAFEPKNIERLKDVFYARWMAKMESDRACQATEDQRIQAENRNRRYDGRPYSVASNGPYPFAECRKASAAGLTSMRDQIRTGAAAYAARQPVSYDGLIALKNARSAYESAFYDRSQSDAGQAKRDIGQAAVGALMPRVAVLERALHGQIVTDVNKAGNTNKVDELFGYDKGLAQAYRTELYEPGLIARLPKRPPGQRPFYQRAGQVQQSNREASQAASFASWTEPTDVEIGLALFRALRNAGGRMVNPNVTTVPGGLNRFGITVLDNLGNLSIQIYDIRKRSCVRASEGFRCTYDSYAKMLYGGAYGGDAEGMMAMAGVGADAAFGIRNTTLLVPTAGGWRAIEAEAAIAKGQAAQLNQLTGVVQSVAQAGASAISVMTDTRNPDTADPIAKKQREDRDDEERQKRR